MSQQQILPEIEILNPGIVPELKRLLRDSEITNVPELRPDLGYI